MRERCVPPPRHAAAGCPACGGVAYRPTVSVRGTQILQCATCHLATWDWQSYDPAAFYDERYWRSDEIGKGYADYFSLAEAMALTHARRLRAIRRQLSCGLQARSPKRSAAAVLEGAARPRLLDAGCGPGFFVRAAREAGFDAAGVEVSQYAVDFARRELGADVRQGTVSANDLPPGPFDVVTLWDVIEHLPDPLAALRAATRVLRPGGLIVLSTGDYASLAARLSGSHWHLFNLPEHLWFFTPASLRQLLDRAGLTAVDCCYELCWHPIRYLVERLESAFRVGRVLSRALGPLGRVALPVTLGDVMTLSARSAKLEVRSEK